jgi:uncharacterized protein
MTSRSALYVGTVIHRRLRPRVHRLRYRAFWMLLDLDELDQLPQRLRLFALNRLNAFSFYNADHGDGSSVCLREQIAAHLQVAGIENDGGRIRLLCMPRIFGYGFNPLSIYFCYRKDGLLTAIIYEVHNTFRQRHSYLIPVEPTAGSVIVQECQKDFYVSPFMDMDLKYDFRLSRPGKNVSLAIDVRDGAERVLTAALIGKRATLTDRTLVRVLITHPALTLKVIAAIHWHALRMLLKGFTLRPRPMPSSDTVAVVSGKEPRR